MSKRQFSLQALYIRPKENKIVLGLMIGLWLGLRDMHLHGFSILVVKG